MDILFSCLVLEPFLAVYYIPVAVVLMFPGLVKEIKIIICNESLPTRIKPKLLLKLSIVEPKIKRTNNYITVRSSSQGTLDWWF